MAIDLTLRIKNRLPIAALSDEISQIIADLIQCKPHPPITIGRVEDGMLVPQPDGIIGNDDGLFVVAYEGRSDKVWITTTELEPSGNEYQLTLSVGATRSAAEYVLGLAGAIAIGLREKVDIVDQSTFWTKESPAQPKHLVTQYRLNTPNLDFDASCTELVKNRLH